MNQPTLNKILTSIKQPVIATVHKDPDPDAIGSLLALYFICKQFKIKLECYASDFIETKFDYLPGSTIIN